MPPVKRGAYGISGAAAVANGLNLINVNPSVTQLNAADAVGLKAIVWLGALHYSGGTFTYERSDSQIVSDMAAIGGHPAVYAYQICDEPDRRRKSGASVSAINAKVLERGNLIQSEAADGKPTYVTISTWDGVRLYGYDQYTGIADIYGYDVYPYTYTGGQSLNGLNNAIAAIHNAGISRFIGIPQGFGDSYYRMPTAAETQAQLDIWDASGWEGYMAYHWTQQASWMVDWIANHQDVVDVYTAFNAESTPGDPGDDSGNTTPGGGGDEVAPPNQTPDTDPSVTAPAVSLPGNKLLGCGIPSVYLTYVGGGQRLAELKVSSVSWRRVLDEISEARVQLAAGQSAECLTVLQALDAFLFEMSIYRDAEEAWVGPVTEPVFTYKDASIIARDLVQWFERRVLPFDRTFVNTDLAEIAAQYMVDAMSIDQSPNILFTVNPTNVLGSRTVLGITFRRAADEIRELARSGLDFTAVGRRILCGGREIGFPRLPTLTEDIFEINPYRLAGLNMANHVIVLGATPEGVTTPLIGQAGGVDTPVVQITVQEPSILDIPSATAAAETRWRLMHTAPGYITGRLLESAPIGIADLIPGVIARVRQQVGFRYVDADYRLVGVECTADVSDAGTTETVTLVLQPVGSVEGG